MHAITYTTSIGSQLYRLRALHQEFFETQSWVIDMSQMSIVAHSRDMDEADIPQPVLFAATGRHKCTGECIEDPSELARCWQIYDYFALDLGHLIHPSERWITHSSHHVSLAYYPESNKFSCEQVRKRLDKVLKQWSSLRDRPWMRPQDIPLYRGVWVEKRKMAWLTPAEKSQVTDIENEMALFASGWKLLRMPTEDVHVPHYPADPASQKKGLLDLANREENLYFQHVTRCENLLRWQSVKEFTNLHKGFLVAEGVSLGLRRRGKSDLPQYLVKELGEELKDLLFYLLDGVIHSRHFYSRLTVAKANQDADYVHEKESTHPRPRFMQQNAWHITMQNPWVWEPVLENHRLGCGWEHLEPFPRFFKEPRHDPYADEDLSDSEAERWMNDPYVQDDLSSSQGSLVIFCTG